MEKGGKGPYQGRAEVKMVIGIEVVREKWPTDLEAVRDGEGIRWM